MTWLRMWACAWLLWRATHTRLGHPETLAGFVFTACDPHLGRCDERGADGSVAGVFHVCQPDSAIHATPNSCARDRLIDAPPTPPTFAPALSCPSLPRTQATTLHLNPRGTALEGITVGKRIRDAWFPGQRGATIDVTLQMEAPGRRRSARFPTLSLIHISEPTRQP